MIILTLYIEHTPTVIINLVLSDISCENMLLNTLFGFSQACQIHHGSVMKYCLSCQIHRPRVMKYCSRCVSYNYDIFMACEITYHTFSACFANVMFKCACQKISKALLDQHDVYELPRTIDFLQAKRN